MFTPLLVFSSCQQLKLKILKNEKKNFHKAQQNYQTLNGATLPLEESQARGNHSSN